MKIVRINRQQGVILPIVLVVMMIVTTLVITQVRRGTVAKALAGTGRGAVRGRTAAASCLRWCESVVINTEPRLWDNVLPSQQFQATPAWRSNINPNLIKTVPNTVHDLPAGPNNDLGTYGVRDRYLRKFRFTTAVTFPEATVFGNVIYRSQSEVRNLIQ